MQTEPTNPAGPWPDPTTLEDVETQRTAVVRRDDMTMDGLRDLFDSAFGPVVEALRSVGAQPAGPAFARYQGDLSSRFTIEVGFPVAGPFDEPVRVGEQVVIPSNLPGGQIAAVTHMGGYDTLAEGWARLFEWVAGQGMGIGSPMWEVYVTEPTPDADPATLRTDLFVVADQPG